MAQEKERAEIGRELHDNINQILTTTKMYLDMALTEKDISEELIMKSHENISSAIEEIRSLSKSLVPPSLGDIGIKEAISEMLDNLNISQKLNIRLKTSGLAKAVIPDKVRLMVFRIVQEQVSNILRHSKATEAEIRLAVHKNDLVITIMDNGVGFDPRKRMKGIGLMNITSRAEVHNGDVDIVSAPGNGCTIKISIPL
jgi:two-component system sensor histidine kinase UhpB